MKFEWDESKNQSNLIKHGFDFADAYRIVRIQVIQKAVNPLLCKHLGELWTNAHSH